MKLSWTYWSPPSHRIDRSASGRLDVRAYDVVPPHVTHGRARMGRGVYDLVTDVRLDLLLLLRDRLLRFFACLLRLNQRSERNL